MFVFSQFSRLLNSFSNFCDKIWRIYFAFLSYALSYGLLGYVLVVFLASCTRLKINCKPSGNERSRELILLKGGHPSSIKL
jgi:hypothetical protein